MLDNIFPFLAAPQFEDAEKSRRSRLLNNIIVVISGITIAALAFLSLQDLLTGSSFPEDTSSMLTFIMALSLVGLNIGLKVLLNRGHLDQVSYFLVSFLFVAGIISIGTFGGIRDSGISIFFLSIALASILLGRRQTFMFMGLSLIVTLVIFFLQRYEMITLAIPPQVGFSEWLIFAIMLILIGLTFNISNSSVEKAFEEARTMAAMYEKSNQELTFTREQLEEDVADRTRMFERRSQYLEAAADVGRAATSIYSLEELLPKVTEFISDRFGFYQVGIFLIDDLGEYAVLRAANSLGGKRMLARGHRLKVGQEGIVGYVTSTGEARIALDIGQDAVHFDTPELPNTRSEMALPLFASGRIFGALDVQSTFANAFGPEDIAALRVLADQVSMSISNAELFEQLQNSIDSERRAYGEISVSAWRNILRSRGSWGYRFGENRIGPVSGNWPKELLEASKSMGVTKLDAVDPLTVIMPISIGGTSIGAIKLKKPIGSPDWTDEEIELVQTLSDRLSQALDSARLYQETQTKAMQELLSSEISSNIRQTLDIDTVLKTAAKELGQAFNAQEVVIRMNPGDSNGK